MKIQTKFDSANKKIIYIILLEHNEIDYTKMHPKMQQMTK